MTELTIRGLRDGELRAYLTAVSAAFGEELNDQEFASNELIFEPARTFVADDGGQIVGGGSSFSFQLTVPGGASVGAAGVTAIGTLPTHRRRGALRGVMNELLADAQRRSDAVSILWASEGSIYQRFGYSMGAIAAEFEILADRTRFRDDPQTLGSTRLIDAEEAARVLPPVYDLVRSQTPGFIGRSQTWWESEILPDPERWRRGAGPKYFVVHEFEGSVAGYAIYRIKNDWDGGVSKSSMLVRELMGISARSERELWRYCFSVDLIQTVRGVVQRADHPLLLMLLEPARLRLVLGDCLWLRIVDVVRALEPRSYATADRVVLELNDAVLPEVAGRWVLDTTGDRPRVERTEEPADMSLDSADLASIFLGAFTTAELAAAGRTVERTRGARARIDRMFWTPRKPWTPTGF